MKPLSPRGRQDFTLQGPASTHALSLHWKPDALSLSLDRDTVYTFAQDGRLFSAFQHGDFYQRGLNHQLLHKGRIQTKHGPQRFRQLQPPEESEPLLAQIYAQVQTLGQAALKQLDERDPSHSTDSRQVLERILSWSPETLAADGQRFKQIYAPISILPPDQYLSIVLQLTLGCSYNRCNFCNFYKDRPFRIKSGVEFAQHIQDVRHFLGAAGRLRKGIFLADGDALMTPQKRLREAFASLAEGYPEIYPKLPVYAFMDAFRAGVKSLADWQELRSLGLKRIYFGIESGDPGLLQFLNKPGSPEIMLAEAQKVKAAGLQLGLIFMIGAGGQTFAAAHRQHSLAWISQLPLDRDDFIFLSEFIPHPDQPYVQAFAAAGLEAFDTEELSAEIQSWHQALKPQAARVVPYHLREFIY